jgi:hypothetical protein
MNRTMKRMALPIGAALILGSSGFAYMASNTFADVPGAGAGTTPISGYQISDVHFGGSDCAIQNSCWLNGVATARDSDAPLVSDVAIKFDSTGWYQCEVEDRYPGPGARGFRCDLRGNPVYPGDIDNLTVVATG